MSDQSRNREYTLSKALAESSAAAQRVASVVAMVGQRRSR